MLKSLALKCLLQQVLEVYLTIARSVRVSHSTPARNIAGIHEYNPLLATRTATTLVGLSVPVAALEVKEVATEVISAGLAGCDTALKSLREKGVVLF